MQIDPEIAVELEIRLNSLGAAAMAPRAASVAAAAEPATIQCRRFNSTSFREIRIHMAAVPAVLIEEQILYSRSSGRSMKSDVDARRILELGVKTPATLYLGTSRHRVRRSTTPRRSI